HGSEEPAHLGVERIQLSEVTPLQVEAVLGEEADQSRADSGQVLRAPELEHDSGDLRLAATKDQLLGEGEVHPDEVVVQLLGRLALGSGEVQPDHVGCTTDSGGEQLDVRRLWLRRIPL